MNHTMSAALTSAAAFTWFGMVLGISGETVLRFRALRDDRLKLPDEAVTRLGVGIGAKVFTALNIAEGVLFVAVGVALAGSPTVPVAVLTVIVMGLLLLQQAAVRPLLNRHTREVLKANVIVASAAVTPNRGKKKMPPPHVAYRRLEFMKALALIVLGIAALATF